MKRYHATFEIIPDERGLQAIMKAWRKYKPCQAFNYPAAVAKLNSIIERDVLHDEAIIKKSQNGYMETYKIGVVAGKPFMYMELSGDGDIRLNDFFQAIIAATKAGSIRNISKSTTWDKGPKELEEADVIRINQGVATQDGIPVNGKRKKAPSHQKTARDLSLTEIKKIAAHYKGNGGTLSFKELEQKFSLKPANGMTAYRLVQKAK